MDPAAKGNGAEGKGMERRRGVLGRRGTGREKWRVRKREREKG